MIFTQTLFFRILLGFYAVILFSNITKADFRMIDFPLVESSVNVETYLQQKDLISKIDIIWTHEQDGWRYWTPLFRKDVSDQLQGYNRFTQLRQGLGYLVKFRRSETDLAFDNKKIYPNSVRLTNTHYSLSSFNLDKDISLKNLFADSNISGGTPADIEEVWQYDAVKKVWRFHSHNSFHPNFNSFARLYTLRKGTAIWIKSKKAGLEIKLNNEAPVISITGTSSIVPPNNNVAPSISRISPSIGLGDIQLQNTEATGLCNFNETDSDPIGTATLVSSDGYELASTGVYCPTTSTQKISYSLALSASVMNHLNEFPDAGKNSVIRIILDSGQEQKLLISDDLKALIELNQTSIQADLDTTSTFIVAVAEMELAKRAGLAADQLNLGVAGNSESGQLIDLSAIWGNDDYPIDMLRFKELINQMIPEDPFGTEPQNHIHQIFQTIEDLNDPSIDANIRQSVNQFFTTTPQDSTKRIQALLNASLALISTNVEAQKNSILLGTENPVEICAQKLLEVDPSELSSDGTDNLINACNMVEENVKLAVAVAGDPIAKKTALENISKLANDFNSETLSRIASSPTPFEFLNLTAKLLSFPRNLVDLLGENQQASEALAAILGQSAELLAEAKAIDAQVAMYNDTRKAEILAAIKALEAENARLEKVLVISSNPDEIVRRLANYIANGGDPSKINEVSELLNDRFADGTILDYGKLIDEVRKTTHNPVDIILDLIRSSSDKLLGMKVFAEAAHLLSAEQLNDILNNKQIKDEFALDRNILAVAGRDKELRVPSGSYSLELDGSRSFDPRGDTNLKYTWQEIDDFRGNVLTTLSDSSLSPKAMQILSSPNGFRYYRLTVSNNDGSKADADEVRIQFFQHPLPVVIFKPAYLSTEPNREVTASVADSYYPEGDEIDSLVLEQVEGPTAYASLDNKLLSFTPTKAGIYVFRVSASVIEATTTMIGSNLLTVRVRDQFPPEVDAGPDTQILLTNQHTLSNFSFSPNQARLSYQWSPDLFLDNPRSQHPVFSPEDTGQYDFTLTVTDEFGFSGEDTVRIEVVRSFPPIPVTTESIEIDFRNIATSIVQVALQGCSSYGINYNITKFKWTSTTHTRSITNSTSCSTSVQIREEDYQEAVTEHFFLEVEDGHSSNEGTFSVRVIPGTSLPPEILLESFPSKEVYTAGDELDIESWQSFSYNDKPLLFTWTPLDQESHQVSRTLRSRFQGIQRDTLEVSVPDPLGTTATITKDFHYQLTVTERNSDNSLGLSSSQIVKIKAAQVCPVAPVIRSLKASQLKYREGNAMNVLELEAQYAARCKTSDGQDHPLHISWNYDSSFFTPDTTSVASTLKLTLQLDEVDQAPLTKEISFTVKDLINNSSSVETVSIDILPELTCELHFGFPAGKPDGFNVYKLTPDRSYILAGSFDCTDPLSSYPEQTSFIRVHSYEASFGQTGLPAQRLTTKALIYEADRGNSKPKFEFSTSVYLDGVTQRGYEITVDDFSLYESLLQPVYVNAQYLDLQAHAVIVQRRTNQGAIKFINSTDYQEKTTASQINLRLDASRSKNLNTTGGPLNYHWEVLGDSSNLSITANGSLATATVSGLAAFEKKDWQIRMTVSDQSGKAASASADLKIEVEQDNLLPVLTNLQIPGKNIYNNVSITFDLYDFEGEHSSIQFEYSTDGSEWLTSLDTVERSEPLSDTAPGILKGFIWKAHHSLPPGNYESAQIRLTPTDVYDRLGNTELSDPFFLSIPSSPVVSAIIVDRICREQEGDSIINVESTSHTGGCVTETVDFHLTGLNQPHPYEDTFRYSWSSNSITSYEFIEEVFQKKAHWDFGEEAEVSRMNLAAVEYKNKLYFWGGTVQSAEEVFNTIHIYDPANNDWSQGSSGGTGRRLHAAVLHNGSIYHYGGRLAAFEGDKDPSTELIGTIDIYGIETDSWKTISTTTLEVGFRHNLGVVHQGKIYQFGGWRPVARGTRTGKDYSNHMYIFDLAKAIWTEETSPEAPTIEELEPMTADLHDGIIYYSGGQASGMYRRVWSYEIATGNWNRSAAADPVPWQASFANFSTQSSHFSTFTPHINWQFPTGDSISVAPALDRTESYVYISGSKLFKLDRKIGHELCSYSGNHKKFHTPVVGPDDTIYVTVDDDKALLALNPDNCTLKWSTADHEDFASLQENNFKSLAKSINHVRRPSISKDGILYAPSGKTLLAINPDGVILWRFVAMATVSRPVIGGDGVIYFGTAGSTGNNKQYKVYAVNPDGQKKWELLIKDSVPRVASINKNEVIFFKGMKSLYAVDRNGEVLWFFTPKKYAPYTAYHDYDNTVYLTDGDYLYALNQDGSLKWSKKGGFRDNPVVGRAGIIYVGSNDKHFHAIDRDGKTVWKFETDNRVGTFPKLSSNGTVFFVNQSKVLHSLSVESDGMADSAWPTFQGDNQNTGRFYVRKEDKAFPPSTPPIAYPEPTTPGQQKWFFDGCKDDNFITHPALGFDGTVYFACNQPTSAFFAVNPDGTEKWNQSYAEIGAFPHISAPAVTPENHVIYAVGGACKGSGNSFTHCNKGLLVKQDSEGTVLWSKDIKISRPSSPALGPDGSIYLNSWQIMPGQAADRGHILAFDADGKIRWSFKTSGSIFPPVIGIDGTVYEATYRDLSEISQRKILKTQNHSLSAYFPEGGLKWVFNLDSSAIMVPAINTRGDIIVVTRKSILSVSSQGELNWSEPLQLKHDPFQKLSPAIDKNDVIYIPENRQPDARLLSFTSSGKQDFSTSLIGYPFISSPTIGRDGTVYLGAGTHAKAFYFSINSSGILTPTTFFTESPSLGSAVIATDGTVYFGTQHDGKLYAITSTSYGLRKGGWPRFKHENQSTAYLGAYDDDYGKGGDGTLPPEDEVEDPREDDDYEKDGPGTDPDQPSQPPDDKTTSPSDGKPPTDSQPPDDDSTNPIVIKPGEPPSSGFPNIRTRHASVLHNGKLYFYGGDTGYSNGYFTGFSNSVDIYDITKDRWEWGVAAPVGRSAHSGLKVDDTFYFWGGSDGEEAQNSLEIFKPASIRTDLLYRVVNIYTRLIHNVTYQASFGLEIEPARRKISNHASAVWNNQLFVLGGEDESGITNQVTVYDISAAKIAVSTFEFNNLYHSRRNAAAAVWKDKLIIIGGENLNGPQRFVEVYDLSPKGASLQANYSISGIEAIAGHSAEVWEDKLYLIGGYGSAGPTTPNSHITSIQLRDTSAQSLGITSFSSLTTARYDHASTILQGTIYVIGGTDGHSDLKSIEAYQLLAEGPHKLDNIQLPDLKLARKRHTAVTYKDKILISGGSVGGFNSSTPEYLESIEVLQRSASHDVDNMAVRIHPSYGAEYLTLARAGLESEVINDLIVLTGGLGRSFPSNTLEVFKFTENNAQPALASAQGSALLTFSLKRLKPTAIISTPIVSGTSGIINICFDLEDPTGQPADISLEISEDGGDTWTLATPIEGVGIDLTAVSTGVNRCLNWNSSISYPGNYRDLMIRIKAADGSVSPPSPLFNIINSPAYVKHLPVISNLIRGNSDRGLIQFSYDLSDGNGDNASIEVFFFNGLELQPIEVLENLPVGTDKTYTWNSSAYESSYLSNTYLLMLPTDSVVGEEGTSDQSDLFNLNNGQLNFDAISVTAQCNGTTMSTTNGELYECSNIGQSTAIFTLDASSALNENLEEGIIYQWSIAEAISGADLTQTSSAVAILTISDDGVVTSDNNERVIEVLTTVSQAGSDGQTIQLTTNLILKKLSVNASARIVSYSCGASTNVLTVTTSSLKAACTEDVMQIKLDASDSSNPNFGGTNTVWESQLPGKVLSSDQNMIIYEVNLPTAYTEYQVIANVFDSPNAISSASQELNFELKKTNDNQPIISSLNVEVDEASGVVTVSLEVTDEGNGKVYPNLENMFSTQSLPMFTPSTGTITGLSETYQTPATISYVWNSKLDIPSCEEGIKVGISLTDEEDHITTKKSAAFDLWNCGNSGSVTGVITLTPPAIIGSGDQGIESKPHCVYDSEGILLTTSNPIGVVSLLSVGGKILTTGPILCNATKDQYAHYRIDLALDLRLAAKQESRILENSLLEARFNSGQFFGLIDVQNHANELANATPNSRANWSIDMDEKANYFYYFIRTLEPASFANENFHEAIPPIGKLDIDILRTSMYRAFESTDSYFITTRGYVHKVLQSMLSSGQNSPYTTVELEDIFLAFFKQEPSSLLNLTEYQRTTLIATYDTLKDLILERSSLSSDSPLTSVLDTMIAKLMRIGIPGTVEGDPRTNDPGSMCNYSYFSQTIANLLDNTISLANQTQGTGFEFAGQEKLDDIIAELSSPGLLEPTSCDIAELTLTRLIQQSIEVSDEFLVALAQNTEAAKNMAALIGEANAALASKNASAITSLSTALAEISELDLYLKKLAQANEKLKTLANATVDSDALEDLLAESIKQSAKATGGTINLLGLIKDLADSLDNGSSVGINYGSIINKVVGGNEVNKIEFLVDVLNQQENQAAAAEIFEQVAAELGRDEIQYIVDRKFADSNIIYASIGEGQEISVRNGSSATIKLSASGLYDPDDKEGDDSYRYHWTISHENPAVPEVSFSSSFNSTTVIFSHVDTEFELSVFDLVLDDASGSLRKITLEIENPSTGNRSRRLQNHYLFYSTAPPVADAGRYASVPVGTAVTLDATASYLPEPSQWNSVKYLWNLKSYPITNPPINSNSLQIKPNDLITASYSPPTAGMYEFQMNMTAVDLNGNVHSDSDTVKKFVYAKPPLAADAGYDALIRPNTDYQLTNQSFAPDQSGLIYSWDPPTFLNNPNIKEPIFNSPVEGEYELKLTVEDSFGQVKSDTVIVTVEAKRKPFVSVGDTQEFQLIENQAPFIITLNADSSFSYQGETMSYEWTGESYLNGSLILGSPNSASTTFEIIPKDYTREGKLIFTVKVSDSSGSSTRSVAVRIIPPTKNPIVILKKDPIRRFYRSTESLRIIASDSYSRQGKKLSFDYEQIAGPPAAIVYSPTGAHVEAMDSAKITLPDFEEELIEFGFRVSVIDLSSSTAYLEIATSTQDIFIDGVPLARKPIIRDVPCPIETRLVLGAEQPEIFIDASASRTLDHDDQDLRHPMAFNWIADTDVLSILDSSASSSVLKFKVNTEADAIISISESYTTTVVLLVSDTVNGKTASKNIEVIIYPAYNPLKFAFHYLKKYQVDGFSYPFFDKLSHRYIYKSQTTSTIDTISFNASFDNSLNVNHPDLINAHIYGPAGISITKNDGVSSPIFTLESLNVSSGVTKVSTSGEISLSGNATYHIEMQGGIANGMHFSERFSLFATDAWVPLSLNPVIVKSITDGSKTSNHNLPANGAILRLMGEKAVISLDSGGINQNGGTLNYSYNLIPGSYPANLTDQEDGMIDLAVNLPEDLQTVTLSIIAADSMGRPDISNTAAIVEFNIQRDRSAPAIILLTNTVEIIDNNFLQARFNLIDSDMDLNDIALHYSVDGTPYQTAISVQGETRVKQGNDYTVRWYFKTDGSFYLDNRKNVTIKLTADDGSFHEPAHSNSHTLNFEVDSPWSDYTGGVLSVENVLELTGSTFVEVEPNGIQKSTQPLLRAKAGDSFQLQGKVSHMADLRDSFNFEVQGTAQLSLEWLEGKREQLPELGIYDVYAAKFIHFNWEATDKISGVVLNAHGGLREYEVVVFHPNEHGGNYKIKVTLNELELDRTLTIRELEPNNTAFDAQYLGNLSRSLSYDLKGQSGDHKGTDFFEFDIFGIYPLQFSLYPYTTDDQIELSLTIWNSKSGQQIRHFSRRDELHGFLELNPGRYVIEVKSSMFATYLLRLQQGNASLANSEGLAGLEAASLKKPNRNVPVGVNYFEGLYQGHYSEIVSGELTFITPDNSTSGIARSVMRVGTAGNNQGAPKFQTIRLNIPTTQVARSMSRVSSTAYKSYHDMADRYAQLFHTIEALETYRNDYGTEQVQHTHYYYTMAVQPDDTKYATGKMWNIDAINLPEAWEITKGSKNVIVAVIDGGPAYHVDIMSSSSDPDGKFIQGYDFVDNDNDPFISTGNIHGGHVAGTIGAKANNGQGIVGKNWEVSIMPLRVCPGRSCNGNAILNAILYAAGLPNSSGQIPPKAADVMNMSLGGPGYDSPTHPYNTAMIEAVSAGTLPVCAAGNDGADTDVTFYAPCGFDACMCVSAISSNLTPAGFTNYGTHIDISAPGVQIWSTVLNNDYEAWQGTSMAAPHVAGVAGLIKSINSSLTPQELRSFLEETSTDLGAPGKDDYFGNGFLNAFKAAEAVGEDAGIFGPKLGTVPSRLVYAQDNSYQEMTIVNKGSEDITNLSWSVNYTTARTYDWLVFRPEADFGTTASSLGIYADKYHLYPGEHKAIVTINGFGLQSGEPVESVTVSVIVSVGVHEVLHPLIKVEALQNGVVIAHTYTSYQEGFHYALDGLQEGQLIQIRAGTDYDHDGEICDRLEKWCGTLGGFDNPSNINILDGSYRADLRFDVTNFVDGYYRVPSITNLQRSGDRGDITITYDSLSSHPVSVQAHYRESLTGVFHTIPSTHFNTSLDTIFERGKTVIWKSKKTLPVAYNTVEFMLTVVSELGGPSVDPNPVLTFVLYNNAPPQVNSINFIPEPESDGIAYEYRRDISILVDVSDEDLDPIGLSLQYRLGGDQTPWINARSISGQLDNLNNGIAKFLWHSNFDINTNQPNVTIRVTANDGRVNSIPRKADQTIIVNNGPILQSAWKLLAAQPNIAGIPCEEIGGVNYLEKLYFICGKGSLSNASTVNSISSFDLVSNSWDTPSPLRTLNIARTAHTVTLVEDQIYVFGGRTNTSLSESLDSLEKFDPVTGGVTLIGNGGTKRRYHAAASYNSRIYFHGGTLDGGFVITNTMDVYDTRTKQWSATAPSPSPRYQHSAVVYGGKIYMFGGMDKFSTGSFLPIEVYDIENDSWTSITNPWPTDSTALINRRFGTASVLDGRVYLLGGFSTASNSGEPNFIDVFDLQTNKFLLSSLVDPMDGYRRSAHASASYNGKIYLFGGQVNDNAVNILEEYTPKSQDLRTFAAFNRPTATIIEGNWELTLNISLSDAAIGNEKLDYVLSSANSATRNQDFSLNTGTINFTEGQQSATIQLNIHDDTEVEENETFTLILSNPINLGLGTVSTLEITIFDDDQN